MTDERGRSNEPGWARDLDAGLREGFRKKPEADDSVLARIEARGTPAPHVILGDVPSADTPVLRPSGGEVVGRYQVHGEIARGGVGIVLKGRDVDLGREVAMKVIRPEHADQPDILRRFVEEAQIGGQLQHPGIVPVYEIGMREDRRIFFTMKLIRGQTFAAILRSRATEEERGSCLRIFEQVCQTVAYAHARGVIHRDLKPTNVMVGAFGEVQVVDWGFAKVLAQGGVADERRGEPHDSKVHTVRSGSGGSDSKAGSVMGTPAYMPPEQALGQVESLDARSDVFSLGAILCEILTGRPPYTRGGSEALVQAAQGDVAEAHERLAACGAEEVLVDLCRRCLSPEPRQRPADAGEVASAVAAHAAAVEERARTAQVEAEKAKVKAAAERRARRLTIGLAASVLLAIGAVATGLMVAEHQRRRVEKATAQRVNDALHRAEKLLHDERWVEAAETAERAVELAAGTDLVAAAGKVRADILVETERLRRNAALLTALERVRTARGEQRDLAEADHAYADAFAEVGIRGDGADVNAAVRLVQETGIASDLAAYLDEWFWIRGLVDHPRDHLRQIADAVDDDPWRRRLRAAVASGDKGQLAALAADPDLEGSSPNLLALHLTAAKDHEGAVRVLRAAQRERPNDFWVNYDLGFGLTLLVPPLWSDAAGFFRVALGARPQNPEVRHQLGIALLKGGRLDEALAVFEDAAAAGDVHAYDHVIETAERLGVLGARIEAWRADAVQGDWVAHYRLGRAFETRDEWQAAITEYRKAFDLEPSSFLLERIGKAHIYAEEYDLALDAFKDAIEMDPACDTAWRGISDVHFFRGEFEEALGAVDRALEIDPYDPFHYDRRKVFLMWLERRDESRKAAEDALRVRPDHSPAREHLARLEPNLDEAARIWEEVLMMPERFAEGRFAMMVESGPDIVKGGQKRRAVLGAIAPKASQAINLGRNRYLRGRWREAADLYKRALAYTPGFRIGQLNLGFALRNLGDHEEAAELFRAALEHSETAAGDPHVRYYLGFCLLACGRYDEAAEQFREFGKHPFMRNVPPEKWERYSAEALRLARDLSAIRAGTRAWASPREQLTAAWMCDQIGYGFTAARLFDAAFTAQPKLAAESPPWPRVWHHVASAVWGAIVTGRGLASDGQEVSDEERRRWRKKAIEWMRLDMELWRKRNDPQGELEQIASWWNETAYMLMRLPENLAELPQDEREAWQAIWREVDSRRAELAKGR